MRPKHTRQILQSSFDINSKKSDPDSPGSFKGNKRQNSAESEEEFENLNKS